MRIARRKCGLRRGDAKTDAAKKGDNMRTSKILKAACAAALFLAAPTVSMADDDSSSDVEGGFAKAVETSDAVIIRVPLNKDGLENTDAAEIRVSQGEK